MYLKPSQFRYSNPRPEYRKVTILPALNNELVSVKTPLKPMEHENKQNLLDSSK